MKKLVIVGGGHAHVEVLRQFGQQRPADVEIILVSAERHTPYSGMLPGLVAGHYTFDQCHIDLQPLAQVVGARFVAAQALHLDAANRRITLSDGSTRDYDVISLNVGSVPIAQDVPGVAEHAIAIKPVSAFLKAWETLITRVQTGGVRALAVVGGGAAGIEILLAMQHRFAHMSPRPEVAYQLVTDTATLLPFHAGSARTVMQRSLARKGVTLHCGARVTRVEAGALIVSDVAGREQRIIAEAVVWVTGAAPPAWLEGSGLALNERKFIHINNNLCSVSHPEVFAVGDCATVQGATYPKSGVYAVRQGPILAANLRGAVSAMRAGAMQTYTPQPHALALISTGERHAIASWGAMSVHGNWVWRWKDRIDQAFMAKYRGLPL